MTDRTYPTAAEAREAAFRIGAEGGCRADALRRAIERAQQAAVREALMNVPCCDEETGEEGWITCGEEYDGAISLCARCQQTADAERALDALEEAR